MAGAGIWQTIPLNRSNIVQEDLVEYPISLDRFRVHDAFQTLLPGTPLTDDLGLSTNTFGTDSPTLDTEDHKAAGAVNNFGRAQVVIPPEYVAGQSITLRVNAGMVTTVSDTTATLDVEAYRKAAPSVDICATAAQSMNDLAAADLDFVITPTNVVVGDTIDIRLTTAINDGATGTAVIGRINSAKLLLDIKG